MSSASIDIEITEGDVRSYTDLVCDFTGTLSRDGALLPGVAERLRVIAARARVTVLTADTFGTAKEALAGLPVDVRVVATGEDKASIVAAMGGAGVVAIGNGRNDVPMMARAGLRIAVIGPEGAAVELLGAVDVVTGDIGDALDLLIHPLRLRATLRD